MSKRALVPIALHSELVEYSSLLRALRTSNTLDITAHIAKAQPSQRRHEDEDHDLDSDEDLNSNDDDDDDTEDRSSMRTETLVAGSSDLSHLLNVSSTILSTSSAPQPQTVKRKRKRPQPRTRSSKPQPQRDAWTRWPLLADDVHVPEWGLEDEIAHMAAQTLKLRPHPPLPAFLSRGGSSSNEDSDSAADLSDLDPDPDPDAPSYIPHLTALLSTRLSSLLALLAQHTPARPPSMQNRIEPLTWRSVVDILASASGGYFSSVNDSGGSSTMLDGVDGLCDEKMLKNIISRMERVYGSYNSPASAQSSQPSTLTNEQPVNEEPKLLHRLRTRIAAAQKLSAILNALDASLFTIDLPPSLPCSHPPPSSTSAPTHSPPRTPRPAPSLPSPHSPPSSSSSPYNHATAENDSYVVPRLLAPCPDSDEREGEYELESRKRPKRGKKPLPRKKLERERGKWARTEEERTSKEGGRKRRRVGNEEAGEQSHEGGKKKKPRLDPVLLQTERELSPEPELEQGTARRSKRPRKEVNYRLKRRKGMGGAGKVDGGEEGQ
ncbi:hypothetical protein BDQ12DRAFT_739912 [Crucibulum laeve]|uniref:Uncharacterized protein n=1 Tax=Crucibulum laeve TaxID=68775 RepID=A0A5C3LFK9_9AGAR|nr:hypothetical protein BDQ12DRAFT_739912 [Crucibulum laeve]